VGGGGSSIVPVVGAVVVPLKSPAVPVTLSVPLVSISFVSVILLLPVSVPPALLSSRSLDGEQQESTIMMRGTIHLARRIRDLRHDR
jgi:hypothetical protein